MKTLSIVTPPLSVISANFIVEHKDFPLSIIPSVYNHHFFKICIVPKEWDYRQEKIFLLSLLPTTSAARKQERFFCLFIRPSLLVFTFFRTCPALCTRRFQRRSLLSPSTRSRMSWWSSRSAPPSPQVVVETAPK